MTEHDPLDRLRAADPAREVEVSDDFVRRVLARTSGATEPSDGAEADAAGPSAVVDLATERKRRRRWGAPLAAAAAAAVFFGVGGYAAGAGGFVVGGSLDSAEPAAESVEDSADTAESDSAASDGDEGALPEAAADSDPVEGESSYPGGMGADGADYGSWRMTFTGTGFSEQPGTATVYGYDAAVATSPQALTRLPGVFGMTGELELDEGRYFLENTGQDNLGSYLDVELDATAMVIYSNSAIDPWMQCEPIMLGYKDGEDSREYVEVEQEYERCMEEAASVEELTESELTQTLREVLADLGMDPDRFAYETFPGTEYELPRVSGTQQVDGLATDSTFELTATTEGIVQFYGNLAPVQPLGEYPTVSESEALERLNDPRFGASRTWSPAAEYEDDPWTPPTAAPSLQSVDEPIPWPVTLIDLVSVEPALITTVVEDGGTLLLPGYTFTTPDGSSYTVNAVADDALDFSTD